jgi:transmembrane sensor
MSDLAERVRAIGEQVDAGYDARRTEAALAGLRTKLGRRRVRRVSLGSTMGMLCLLAGTFWALRSRHETRMPIAVAKPETLFALSDGSVVTPLDPTSRLLARSVSARLVELELVAGSAHFEVAPNREREFRVRAGRVQIVVVGTKFSVERQGERTAVVVQGGRVRVEWERGQQILDPGERGSFPPFEPASEAAPAPDPVPAVEPRVVPARPGRDWRVLAQHGDFSTAFHVLHDKAKPVSLANLDDLLLAADVARRSGHPATSVPYLERAMALHGSDARAAVVAFTLGRVRLADLDDPAGAAAAFAQARAAAPNGPLAEDALAREVEARFRAGDQAQAHALAAEYVKTWPSGSRLRAVRHFGGLP